jgi:hypothetical protein
MENMEIHYLTYFSFVFSISFLYSTYLSSIFSKSFHYSTYLSSTLSKSYHHSIYFYSIFSLSFHLSTYYFSYSPCPFSAKCTCTKLLSLFSPFYLNLPKVDFLYVFVWKQSYTEINLGYFYFLPQGRYFLLYMYNFCIKGHLLIYGYIKVWPVKNPCDQILRILS